MPVARGRGELRVKLGRDEPGMARQLDDFDQPIVREAREPEASARVRLQIIVVELEAMPVALGNHIPAVELAREGPGLQMHILRPEPHGAAALGALIPGLCAAGTILPLGDQRDYPMRGGAIEL